MGINHLWETVQPTGKHISLRQLTRNEAVQRKESGARHLILGVDTRTLMCECEAAAIAASVAAGVNGQVHGGALRIFFGKLCNFLKGGATLIFVLDGDRRPPIKRGAQVITDRPIWWTEKALEVIGYCGYYHYKAPGEAEAELADLNRRGLIDGVITSDSDTLIFGAARIFRSIPKKDRKFDDEVILYTSETIRHSPDISLTPAALLLFALLVGGDYDNGIYGCGHMVALGLVRCKFGEELFQAVSKNTDLDAVAARLRSNICSELRTNSQGMLGSRHPSLASRIPNNFPDQTTLDLYTKPLTSWTRGETTPNSATWLKREPIISNIAQFCFDNFGWNTEPTLVKGLQNQLWEGVFIQMLLSPLVLYDADEQKLASPDTEATILKATRKARKGQFTSMGTQPRLSVSTSNFVALMRRGYNTSKVGDVKVWVPDNLLPAGVVQLLNKGKPKRKRTGKNTKPKKEPPTLEKNGPANDAESNDIIEISLGEYEANKAATSLQKRKRQESSAPWMDIDLVGAGEQLYTMEEAGSEVVSVGPDDRGEGEGGDSTDKIIEIPFTEFDAEVPPQKRRRGSSKGSGQWLGVIDLTQEDGVGEGSGGGYDEDFVVDI